MSVFGKIFIFEKYPETIKTFQAEIESLGFFVFGLDNLYQFLQYSDEINPDIVIMNFSADTMPDAQTWIIIEKNLRQKSCPEIYANIVGGLPKYPKVHRLEFNSDTLKKDHIINIIKKNQTNYLH